MTRSVKKWLVWMIAVGAIIPVLFVILLVRPGHPDKIQSSALRELRDFEVFLPASYDDQPTRRYPVIYSLDGEKTRHGALAAANARMVAALTDTTETIVVAVHSNGRRERDFSPGGGAGAFTKYLASELRPYIEARYRSSGVNIISGHSYGGLYALYAFAEHPGLFDAHFAYVPSVFHHEPILERIESRLQGYDAPGTRLFLVSGAESQDRFWRGFNRLIEILNTHPNKSVRWETSHYPLPHPLIMMPGQISTMMTLYN